MTSRVFYILGGIAGSAVFLLIGTVDGWPIWQIFAALGPLIVVDALRTRVEIDPTHDEIVCVRTFTKTRMRLSAIENVRVPPWGPVCLTVFSGESVKQNLDLPLGSSHAFRMRIGEGGVGRTNIVTGLATNCRGHDNKAHELASALGVPVVSIWPGLSTGDDRLSDTHVRPLWLIRWFIVSILVLATLLYVLNLVTQNGS